MISAEEISSKDPEKMSKKNIMHLIANLFMLATAIVMYALILVRHGWIKDLFSYGAYYLILAMFLFWLMTLTRFIQQNNPNIGKIIWSHKNGILISLVITLIIFISVQPVFRVLSDETNLVAVSKSMAYEKRTDNVTMGKWYYDNYYPLNREIEKRPLLFPFFTSILHILIGYRPENVFILNFIVLLALFILIYGVLKTILDELWAIVGVTFTASQPIVSQCATSGGFDLFAAVFLLICMIVLYAFLKRPSASMFQLMWVSLIMLANTRYEGVLPLLIIIGFLVALTYVKLDYFKGNSSIIYFSTPLLMLPVVWQRLLVPNSFENPPSVPPFSWVHFIDNNVIFLKNLVNFQFYLPYATLVNLVGLAGLMVFISSVLINKKKHDPAVYHFGIIAITLLMVYWVLFTSYYFGKMDHPSSSRFFVIFVIVLSVSAVVFLNNVKVFREKRFIVVTLAVLMFGLYHTVSVEDKFSRTQLLPREYRFAMDFFKRRSENERGFIIIASRPGQYTVHNYGAVNFSYANENISVLNELKNHLYENVYVIQEILYTTLEPTKETQLDKIYILEKLVESQNNTQYYTRISRVKL